MENPTLVPVTINPYRVSFTDNLLHSTNTFYFESLKEASETMNHIDLQRYSVTIRKVLAGDEYISYWEKPKQGQHYKMAMIVRNPVCCSKSFFLCKVAPSEEPFKDQSSAIGWFIALVYSQPQSMKAPVVVEIRTIDSTGELSKDALISTNLPHEMQKTIEDSSCKSELLDWFIDRFVYLHSPEDVPIEWLEKGETEKQTDRDKWDSYQKQYEELGKRFTESSTTKPPECECHHCKH